VVTHRLKPKLRVAQPLGSFKIGTLVRRPIHIPILSPLIERQRRMSLLTSFMLLSGLILLVGAIFIGWWINREIEDQVVANSVKLTAVFVDSTIAPHLWELASMDHVSDVQKQHMDQLLRTNIRIGDIVAFHIANRDGTLIYSNLPIPAGTNISTPGMQVALEGQIYSHVTEGIDFAPGSEQKHPNLIETYFPVRDETGTKVIAVASFYQSLDRLRQSILEAQLQGWAVVGIATFLMYVLLFGLVKRGSDTIELQKLDLAESRQVIQNAAVRAAEVNEAAMRRLGADLHDGPAQDLGIALMRMEPLREALVQHADVPEKLPPDPEVIAFDLNLIHTALQSSLQEIRNMAGGLRLPDLGALDLAATIRKAVSDYTRKTGRPVNVKGPEAVAGNDALKSAAYRIVQEALTNGHVHANPTRQTVTYSAQGDALRLIIHDDGSGFDADQLAEQSGRRHLGLAGLQERAEILGGWFSVKSAPGRGTTIETLLPLDLIRADTVMDGG
jgi:signal transduction histidine kinase